MKQAARQRGNDIEKGIQNRTNGDPPLFAISGQPGRKGEAPYNTLPTRFWSIAAHSSY